MPRITEPLNGGLVTSRDPATLKPGELQAAQGVVYFPNDPSLQTLPGRTSAASSLGGEVTGLAHCAFDFVEANCSLTRANATVSVISIVVNTVTTTSGSAIITAPATNNFIGILKGATVTGTGIPASTTVLTWDSPTQITLSANATATGTSNLTFTNAKFANVSAGALISGHGIPDGATVASVAANGTSLVLTTGFEPTVTATSKLIVKADTLLIAQVNGVYKKARPGTAGTTLTFSTLETGVTEGTALEQVHYNNLQVLLNGKYPNKVLMSDGLLRPHGLKAITASPTLNIVAGTWALKDGAGFYAYWTTEYDIVNDVESDYNAGVDANNRPRHPALIQISSTGTQAVSITRPPRVNATATHWRVYRSIKYTSTTVKSAAKENQFPNGYLIAQLELRDDGEQTSTVDGGGATTIATVPAGTAISGTGVGTGTGISWANPTNATGAANTVYAKLIRPAATSGSVPDWSYIMLELGGFSFASVSAPITGITVNVYGRRVGNSELIAKATVNSEGTGDSLFGSKTVPLTTGTDGPHVLGGVSEKWGRDWNVSDFSGGSFVVRLFGSVLTPTNEVWVDAVTVAVSYGESQEAATGAFIGEVTTPFPGVTVSPFGFTISSGRNGEPPKATTGDIFQDCLFTNDVKDVSVGRYSFPSRIDAFPASYFLNFDTKEQDEITLIRTVGNVAVVGLKHQIYRVNSLPRDTDSEFERGRAVELIDRDHGIASRTAGVVFTLPGHGQVLAYANNYGLFMSDGYRIRPLTTDIAWWETVDVTQLDECIFINNTELQLLEFYFVPADLPAATFASSYLCLHYHPSHLKTGVMGPELKVTGPHPLNVSSAAGAVFPDGTWKLYTGDSTAAVFYENRLVGNANNIDLRTRDLAPNENGNEWKIGEVIMDYALRDYSAASPGALTITGTGIKSGNRNLGVGSKSITVAAFTPGTATNPVARRTDKIILNGIGQRINLRIASGPPNKRMSFTHFIFDAQSLGVENPT